MLNQRTLKKEVLQNVVKQKLFFDLLKYNYNFKVILKPHYILNAKNNISENKRMEQNYFAECVRKKITPSKYLKG